MSPDIPRLEGLVKKNRRDFRENLEAIERQLSGVKDAVSSQKLYVSVQNPDEQNVLGGLILDAFRSLEGLLLGLEKQSIDSVKEIKAGFSLLVSNADLEREALELLIAKLNEGNYKSV